MGELRIPKLNNNDDSYVLLEWAVPTGSPVRSGDCVATIETSKATSDLPVAEDGVLNHVLPAGSTCRPGDIVAHVGEAEAPVATVPVEPPRAGDPLITRAARELIEKHDIDMATVAALGLRVVKESDVAALAGAAGDPARTALSPHQRAVATAVSLSHAVIPAAFTVIKVSATALKHRQSTAGASAGAFIGLPELFVQSLAPLSAAFPRFFATVADDLSLEFSATADIGITIDTGTGLYVPVIRDAGALDVSALAARLMSFRVSAMRRTFHDSDLDGARITVSLHTDPGIVLAQPIVFPGQVCTLSMSALHPELRLDATGAIETHEFFTVGIAYDHRVVNGRDAVLFLSALRDALESVDGGGEPPCQQR